MIIGLDQKMMQTVNQDGSSGEPYVNSLPGHPELFLVMPIREWDDAQADNALLVRHVANSRGSENATEER